MRFSTNWITQGGWHIKKSWDYTQYIHAAVTMIFAHVNNIFIKVITIYCGRKIPEKSDAYVSAAKEV